MILFGLFFVTDWLNLPSITYEMTAPLQQLLIRILF